MKFGPSMAATVIAGDLMTANNQKKGTYTQKQADELAAKKVKDPYMAYLQGDMLGTFSTMGPLYPESWDTMLVDMEYYKIEIPFEKVTVPVFMIHGDCDDDINYSNAERAHKGIPHSILITQKNGTHSCQHHPDWNMHIDQQFAFAKKHCAGNPRFDMT